MFQVGKRAGKQADTADALGTVSVEKLVLELVTSVWLRPET